MATPESKVPIHTVLIWDNSGDPALVSLLAPRCAFGGCHRILRGPVVTYGNEMFHEGCWTAVARNRLREPGT